MVVLEVRGGVIPLAHKVVEVLEITLVQELLVQMVHPVYLAVVMEAQVAGVAMVGRVDTEVLEEFQAVEVAVGQEMTVLAMLAAVDLGEEVK
jgi:hypothetical protein